MIFFLNQLQEVPNTPVVPAATEPVAPTDRLMQEKLDTYGWIHKLMHGNLDEDPRLPVVGDLVQYSLQHLSFKEHNGIQYSFYLRSESENFGFLRFAPSAVKKLTKTSNFLLVSSLPEICRTHHTIIFVYYFTEISRYCGQSFVLSKW